jgi:hypothetical protein
VDYPSNHDPRPATRDSFRRLLTHSTRQEREPQ